MEQTTRAAPPPSGAARRRGRRRPGLLRRFTGGGWQLTVLVVALSQLVAMIGFGLGVPFLPLYVQQLGVTSPEEVAAWAGLLTAIPAVPLALMSPIWGAMADKYGRKLMLVRAVVIGGVVLGLMALAQAPWQLLVLRGVQGAFTGSTSAAVALTAAVVPAPSLGVSLAMVQTCISLGSALGPILGGLLAPAIGFRASFVLSGLCLVLSGLAVVLFVREQRTAEPARAARSSPAEAGAEAGAPPLAPFNWLDPTFRTLLLLMSVSQIATMSAYPLVPIFTQQLEPFLGLSPETIAGFALAATSLLGSVGAPIFGRLGDRVGHQRVVVAALVLAGIAYFPAALATSSLGLLLSRAAVGLALSGFTPSLNALVARATPRGREGVAFGTLATAQSIGSAVGPIAGATLAAVTDIRVVFATTAAMLVVVGAGYGLWNWATGRRNRPRPARPAAEETAPPAEPAS